MKSSIITVCVLSLMFSSAAESRPGSFPGAVESRPRLGRGHDRGGPGGGQRQVPPNVDAELSDLQKAADGLRDRRPGRRHDRWTRNQIKAKLAELMAKLPDDVKAKVKAWVDEIKKKIAAKVPEEIKQAAAAVKSDLEAIMSGGYVTKEDLEPLAAAVKAALADRELTDEEKAALTEQAKAIAGKIPEELRNQLKADVETLKELIGQQRS